MILGWENNIDDLNLVEKTLGELMNNVFTHCEIDEEETNFVKI
jgi:hypothetical protein